jgi:tRNA threonylcarbamoyladenosine biosynthesis protein TsaB
MSTSSPGIDHAVSITLPGPAWTHATAVCIDTSSDIASIAFVERGQVVAEQQWRAGFSHTQQLASRLHGLAAEARFELRTASLICVCTGPGSFNGIRTAMGTAMGLASGLNLPIYGCSALDLLAYPHADRAPAQRAVLPAGRGEYYSALFATRGGRWKRVSPYAMATLQQLAEESPSKCVWCGVFGDDELETLAGLMGGTRRIVPPPHNVRRAAFLVPLALAAAAAGADGSIEALQPIYLRRPSITTPRARTLAGGQG